jgi:hypothetical protein
MVAGLIGLVAGLTVLAMLLIAGMFIIKIAIQEMPDYQLSPKAAQCIVSRGGFLAVRYYSSELELQIASRRSNYEATTGGDTCQFLFFGLYRPLS